MDNLYQMANYKHKSWRSLYARLLQARMDQLFAPNAKIDRARQVQQKWLESYMATYRREKRQKGSK